MLRRLLAASAVPRPFAPGRACRTPLPQCTRGTRPRHRPAVAVIQPFRRVSCSHRRLTSVRVVSGGADGCPRILGRVRRAAGRCRRAGPADAPRLAAVASGTAGIAGRVDLAGMWALPTDPAAPRSHELIRALDGNGG